MIKLRPVQDLPRCSWCGTDPVLAAYHDEEWGVPVHEDRRHFEMLILEGAQAGLSWSIILRKREGYRRAFEGFDPARVARFTDARLEKLAGDPEIVRNRLKIRAARDNARAFLEVQKEYGTFDAFLWPFVGGAPKVNSWQSLSEVPAVTPEAEALSRELKLRGFRFVGPTIMYATMQAVGLVDDHLDGCWRRMDR